MGGNAMNIKNDDVYSYIDEKLKIATSKEWDELDALCNKDEKVKIGTQMFNENCWTESLAEGDIFIIELSKKKILWKTVYSKGLMYKDKKKEVVSQEKMWELGLG